MSDDPLVEVVARELEREIAACNACGNKELEDALVDAHWPRQAGLAHRLIDAIRERDAMHPKVNVHMPTPLAGWGSGWPKAEEDA